MNVNERLRAFHLLGNKLRTLEPEERDILCRDAANQNPWFTSQSTLMAIDGITKFLDETVLAEWIKAYTVVGKTAKTVGVVMAGNIPLVGFHDYLSVLLSGHTLKAKLSSQDAVLLPSLHRWLVQLEPRFDNHVQFADRLNEIDAVIATGSDNTARYFEYYFRQVPTIIRKNRTSVAVLTGTESVGQLTHLGTDVFSYFGLGCRNVAKLFIPNDYDFQPLFEAWESYGAIQHHHKYANNYDYQKSIMLVNRTPFLDTGFVMAKEDSALVSPISVVYYEYYDNESELMDRIAAGQNKIQCVVSASERIKNRIDFGQAQFPAISDFADNVDTLRFLATL